MLGEHHYYVTKLTGSVIILSGYGFIIPGYYSLKSRHINLKSRYDTWIVEYDIFFIKKIKVIELLYDTLTLKFGIKIWR